MQTRICVPRMLRGTPLLRRDALLIRGHIHGTRVPALRCTLKNAAPRPGHVGVSRWRVLLANAYTHTQGTIDLRDGLTLLGPRKSRK
jgi:hypothetical protein